MADRTSELVALALRRVEEREGRTACGGEAGPRRAEHDVAIGSDHGGFELKEAVKRHLRERGYRLKDVGTHSGEACDYPDLALQVAKAVASGEARVGLCVDGVGIGSAMACGKVPGVRAATCFDAFSTKNARAHNDANVLCIGGRVLTVEQGLELATLFLETPFEGGRHQKRVDKIVAIERAFTAPALERVEAGR